MNRRQFWLLCLATAGLAGCTNFGAVRSARVIPGTRFEAAATLSTPPGDDAAWFWSFDCASNCDHPVPSLSLNAMYGVASDMGAAFELGGGIAGTFPYVEGFAQLKDGAQPFGIGARVGLPASGWREDAIYAAYDIERSASNRIIFTTTLFRHGGTSPNGANPGRFVALTQGIGYQHRKNGAMIVPSATFGIGSTRRSSYGRTHSSSTAFLVLGMSIGLGGTTTRRTN